MNTTPEERANLPEFNFTPIQRAESAEARVRELEAENARLREQLTEARKDTARIDCLEFTNHSASHASVDHIKVDFTQPDGSYFTWTLYRFGHDPIKRNTFREMIDAAIPNSIVDGQRVTMPSTSADARNDTERLDYAMQHLAIVEFQTLPSCAVCVYDNRRAIDQHIKAHRSTAISTIIDGQRIEMPSITETYKPEWE